MRKINAYTSARPAPIRLGRRGIGKIVFIYIALVIILTSLAFIISYNVLSIQKTESENEQNTIIEELRAENNILKQEIGDLQAQIDSLTPTPTPTAKPATPKPTTKPQATTKPTTKPNTT